MTFPNYKAKPCPFCGSPDILTLPPTCKRGDPYNPLDRFYPIARCMGCQAEVCGRDEDYSPDERTALEKWNRRVGG